MCLLQADEPKGAYGHTPRKGSQVKPHPVHLVMGVFTSWALHGHCICGWMSLRCLVESTTTYVDMYLSARHEACKMCLYCLVLLF